MRSTTGHMEQLKSMQNALNSLSSGKQSVHREHEDAAKALAAEVTATFIEQVASLTRERNSLEPKLAAAERERDEYKVLTQNKTIIEVSKAAITFISHRYQKTFSRLRKCHVAAFYYLNKLVDCCAKVNLYGSNIFGFLIFLLISFLTYK